MSFGRYCLKLSERAFWRLTLGQLVALARCYEAEQERLDYRTGIIASSILNTIPRTEKTKYTVYMPWDIFPQYGWKPEPEPMNIDQMITLTIAAGGTVAEMN